MFSANMLTRSTARACQPTVSEASTRPGLMMPITPDIEAKVRLFTAQEGGKARGLPPIQYGCPLVLRGEAFDCRLLLDRLGTGLPLGEARIVPIAFLFPDHIRGKVHEGDHFELWEGKVVGEGEVTRVFLCPPS